MLDGHIVQVLEGLRNTKRWDAVLSVGVNRAENRTLSPEKWQLLFRVLKASIGRHSEL